MYWSGFVCATVSNASWSRASSPLPSWRSRSITCFCRIQVTPLLALLICFNASATGSSSGLITPPEPASARSTRSARVHPQQRPAL
jgi:hypothetical protein